MKTIQKLLLAGVASIVTAIGAYAADANVTGTWNLSVTTERGTRDSSMTLTQKGSDVTGTYKSQRGEVPISGTVKGNDLNLSYKIDMQGNPLEIKYAGKVEGDTITGTVELGQMGSGKFTGKKAG
jgi:hypothetical protein